MDLNLKNLLCFIQNKKLGSEILDLLNQPTAKVSNFGKATLGICLSDIVSSKNCMFNF